MAQKIDSIPKTGGLIVNSSGLSNFFGKLRSYMPSPIKKVLRPVWFWLLDAKFRVKYGFSPPPRGTDLSGYEKLINFIEREGILDIQGDIVEIGAFLGGGTYKIAKYLEKKKSQKQIYVIDIFDPNADLTKCIHGITMKELYERIINEVGKGASQWEIFTHVTRNCKNIQVIKGDSKNVQLPTEKVCFAFIDGNHDPSYVKNDFYLIWTKLSPGGVIAFDDYGYDLPQVTCTINELIGKHAQDIVVIARTEKIIFLRKQKDI